MLPGPSGELRRADALALHRGCGAGPPPALRGEQAGSLGAGDGAKAAAELAEEVCCRDRQAGFPGEELRTD